MNAPTLRKQLENILALPLTPVKVAELVKLGRLDGPTPAVHDVAADARAALLKESPEVVVEGFGMVKTNRASFGGLPVYCTFFSRERDGMPPLWILALWNLWSSRNARTDVHALRAILALWNLWSSRNIKRKRPPVETILALWNLWSSRNGG